MESPLNSVVGKTVIITGAAQGMGKSHAKVLAAHGANVVMTDIDQTLGDTALKEVDGEAVFLHHDVTKADHWADVVAKTEATFGPVAGLVNNAGYGRPRHFNDLTEEEYRQAIDVNQISVFLGMKAVAPSMRKRSGGSIVNISSAAGLRAGDTLLAYVGTKFAVTGMTKAAAVDLGPDNIRVNSVHPGLIGGTGLYEANKDYVAPVLEKTPLRRVAKIEETSALIMFLLSDGSGFCSGSEFVVDGGMLCRYG